MPWKKEKPAGESRRDRVGDWWWKNGCYVRLAVSAMALAVSIFAYFMA